MNDDDQDAEIAEAQARALLAHLRQEHADLDASVTALETQPLPDQILIARLKKKKLALRDQIVQLEDELTPDLIA